MLFRLTYVVLDLEWNQAYKSAGVVSDDEGRKLYGEIIQIGAVKLNRKFAPSKELKISVKPKYYTVIHRKVRQITGIDQRELECGIAFETAMTKFRKWCGRNCVFLTWGPDDIAMLRQNMEIYKLDSEWIDTWFNVQAIFNMQTDTGSNQKSLSTAMRHFDISPELRMHDALNDAYYTAKICEKLDIRKGIAEMIRQAQERPIQDEDSPAACEFFGGFASRREVFSSAETAQVKCPVCGKACGMKKWVFEKNGKYISLAECEGHGEYIARIKLSKQKDGKFNVSKMVYDATGKSEEYYAECLRKEQERRAKRRGGRQNGRDKKTQTPIGRQV